MARIITYPTDNSISRSDKLVGSDADSGNNTKNFSIADLTAYFSGQPGKSGESAYELWLEEGNKGSVRFFLNSLVGPKGDQGKEGEVGPQSTTPGPRGPNGTDGNGIKDIRFDENEGTLVIVYTDERIPNFTTGKIVGPKGDTGATGETGPEGRGIKDIRTDVDGELTIVYTDNTEFRTTDLIGKQGPRGISGTDGTGFTGGSYNANTGVVTFTSSDSLGFSTNDLRGSDGNSVTIKGTKATIGDLPTAPNNTVGDLWIVTAQSGDGYVWTASNAWENIGPIQGPEGPAGTPGTQGAPGPAGNGIQDIVDATTGRGFVISFTDGGTPYETQDLRGPTGLTGPDGLNAFQYWQSQNPGGTEAQYNAFIKGDQGIEGPQGVGISSIGDGAATGDNKSFDIYSTDGNALLFSSGNLEGPQGIQGNPGPDGPDGPPGVGLQSVSATGNGDGSFKITFDGPLPGGETSYTSGDLTGPQGPAGPAATWTEVTGVVPVLCDADGTPYTGLTYGDQSCHVYYVEIDENPKLNNNYYFSLILDLDPTVEANKTFLNSDNPFEKLLVRLTNLDTNVISTYLNQKCNVYTNITGNSLSADSVVSNKMILSSTGQFISTSTTNDVVIEVRCTQMESPSGKLEAMGITHCNAITTEHVNAKGDNWQFQYKIEGQFLGPKITEEPT